MELSPSPIIVSLPDFLVASGRFEEAIEVAEKTVAADVNSPRAWANTGLGYFLSGQVSKGIAHYETAVNLFPKHPASMFIEVEASRALIWVGRYNRAKELIDELLRVHPESRYPRVLASLAIAHYHLGELEQTNILLAEIESQSKKTSTGSPSFYLAMINAQMGELDTAFEWLDKAYSDHEVEMYWLKVEPPFEPLRTDPRWKEILDKVGFPE